MTTYRVTFHGRLNGAIGTFHPSVIYVTLDTAVHGPDLLLETVRQINRSFELLHIDSVTEIGDSIVAT